jgi:hypothetical protein
MKGLTLGRTWAIEAGVAKAPFGVGFLPRRTLSAAAWRASTEWIDRAAASICGDEILVAWPR